MGLFKSKAIVIRSRDIAETDKLVTFLTEKYGKIKCAAKSARKIKSRFGASLEPLSLIDMVFFGKEHQEIYKLNHCDIIQSFHTVREDFRKSYVGIYFNELIDSLVPEGDRGRLFFQFLLDSLHRLQHQEELETLCRLFEFRVMALSGYKPNLSQCAICQKPPDGAWMGFSFHRSGIVCQTCLAQSPTEIRFRPGTWEYLKKILTLDVNHSERLKIPRGMEEEIENVTHRYILSHLGRELKSYPFIKKMAVF